MCFFKFDQRLLSYNISPRAMILYAMLSDRVQLSSQNDNFRDTDGVFIYFTLTEIQDVFGISLNVSRLLTKELEQAGLIRKKRQGQGKPNKIYINELSNQTTQKQAIKTTQKQAIKTTQKQAIKTTQKQAIKTTQKQATNHTNINQTDKSYSSIISGNTKNAQQNTIDDDMTAEVKDRIEYQELTRKYKSNQRTLNLIVQLIAANIEQYSEINRKIVENILDNVIDANLSRVRNFKAYLQACLDNAYALPVSDTLKSYPPSYNIAEYEKYSVLDYMDDDEE